MRHSKPQSVLVVEDDLEIRESIIGILEDEGITAVGAENGAHAFRVLESGVNPCLILLDLMMPVMDGMTFRQHQRNHPALSAVPVVILSAYRNLEEHCRGLDAVALLEKPVEIEELLDTVSRYCCPARALPAQGG